MLGRQSTGKEAEDFSKDREMGVNRAFSPVFVFASPGLTVEEWVARIEFISVQRAARAERKALRVSFHSKIPPFC